MYSFFFAGLLVVILVWKSLKLVANRKKMPSFSEIDTYIGQAMNKGEEYEK